MSIETEVAALTTATTNLLSLVQIAKSTLDTNIAQCTYSANTATTLSATAATHSAAAAYQATLAANLASAAATLAASAGTLATTTANTLISAVALRPNINPSLSVDWTKKPTAAALTAAGWTISRLGELTYFGPTPIKTAENLFIQSENLTLGLAWGRNACSVSAITHSTGLLGVSLILDSGVTGAKMYQTFSTSNIGSGTYRIRFLLAAGLYTKVIILTNGRGSAAFDLLAGILLNTGTGATAALPEGVSGSAGVGYTSASIIPHELGNGLYWCEVETTPPTIGSGWWPGLIGYPDTGAVLTLTLGALYTGDGVSGIQVFAAQIQNSFDGDYIPTTTEPITKYESPLLTVGVSELAYQHNSNGECLGLIHYPAATNLALQSQSLNNGAWGRYTVSVSLSKRKWAGFLPFVRITKTGTNTGAALNQVFTTSIVANTYYTATCALIGDIWSSTTSASMQLTLTEDWAGLATDFLAVILLGPGLLQATLSCLIRINGLSYTEPTLVRITRRYSIDGTLPRFQICPGLDVSTTIGASILATRVQIELGSRATPYIPTTTATVTRGSQGISFSGSSFISINNPAEGTLLAKASVEDLVFDAGRGVLQLDAYGSLSFRSYIANNGASSAVQAYTANFSSSQAGLIVGTWSKTPTVAAYAYMNNSFQLGVGGSVSTVDTVGIVPVATSIYIAGWAGLVQRTELYPRAMSSTELSAITTPGVLI